MFHDAPMEAVAAGSVTVHRRRNRGHDSAAASAVAAALSPAERASAEFQLNKVVDYILTFRQAVDESGAPVVAVAAASATLDCAAEKDNGTDAQTTPASPALMTREKPMLKVALQFPDSALADVTAVVHQLESMLHADQRFPAYQQSLREYRAHKERRECTTAAAAATSGGGGGDQQSGQSPAAARAAMAARRTATATATAAAAAGGGGGGALRAAAAPAGSATDNPHAPTDDTRFFILADNTFGSCCPDEITALHYDSDCIVHFGEACMSKATRLPVLYIHPQLRMNAVAPSDGDSSCYCGRGQASLLAAAAARIAVSIKRCSDGWNEQHESAIAPRLVLVGTHSSIRLFDEARKLLMAAAAAAVPVDWCTFVGGDVAVITAGTSEAEEEEEDDDDGTDEAWVVNGARFPRLQFTKSRKAANKHDMSRVATPVQHFLFVGPSTASHPVHLHGVHQYNCFHYSERAREYFDEGCSNFEEEESSGGGGGLPVLFVMDEDFSTGGGDGTSSAVQPPPPLLAANASLPAAQAYLNGGNDKHSSGGGGGGSLSQSALAVATTHRRLVQRSFNIESIRASTAVGILVASLAIAGYYECTMLLHQLLRAYGKRSYILYVGHLNEFKLANFADTVDCFVVVACPNARHCHFPDKADNYMKRVVSPAEVLLALTANPDDAFDSSSSSSSSSDNDNEAANGGSKRPVSSEPYGMPGLYSTEFSCVIAPLRAAVAQRKQAVLAAASGDRQDRHNNTAGGDARAQDQRRESASLIHMSALTTTSGSSGSGVLTATGATVRGSLARLHERSFVGLDPQVGRTEVQAGLIKGKHGIARGYATEREEQGETRQ